MPENKLRGPLAIVAAEAGFAAIAANVPASKQMMRRPRIQVPPRIDSEDRPEALNAK